MVWSTYCTLGRLLGKKCIPTSLNLAHFVACKIWLRCCVSPLRCRVPIACKEASLPNAFSYLLHCLRPSYKLLELERRSAEWLPHGLSARFLCVVRVADGLAQAWLQLP